MTAPEKSLVLRLAARVSLALALAAAVVFGAIYYEVQRSTRALAQAAIDADLAGLVEAQAAGGTQGLAARIGDRLAFVPGSGETPYYLLEDAAGLRIAGNLPEWPEVRPESSPAGITTLPDGTRVQFRATLLRGNVRLLAGRAVVDADAWLMRLALYFGAALVAMAGLAFLIGRSAARGLNARVATISDALARFGGESEGVRAPVCAPGDELDALAGRINALLGRTEHLLAARTELSNTVAHETRSPLLHINARIAKARAAGNAAEADRLLDAAQADIRRLQRMLDALLDIAASEAQRGEMNSLPELDLAELARALVELYAPSVEDMGLTFEVDIAAQVPMRGQSVQLSSLIGNLLDNALKYGAAGGKIRLHVQPGPVIEVADNGPGIDPALAPAIFDRFRRADHGSGGAKGHGLGLALVRAIAERHGLMVSLEPAEGAWHGARFVVR